MEIRALFILSLILSFVCSCKKAEDRSCFKSTGSDDERVVQLSEVVDTLFLRDNFDYILVHDTANYIRIIGGENVIPWVRIEEGALSLSVTNDNRCNFLRSFKRKISIEIHLSQLKVIRYFGGGSVSSGNTLEFPVLYLFVADGGGAINLNMNTGYIEAAITRGYGDFTFTGNTFNANLFCQSNSFCDTRGLQVEGSIKVLSNSAADMLINADGANLEAETQNRGDIRFWGEPTAITAVTNGEGQIIQE